MRDKLAQSGPHPVAPGLGQGPEELHSRSSGPASRSWFSCSPRAARMKPDTRQEMTRLLRCRRRAHVPGSFVLLAAAALVLVPSCRRSGPSTAASTVCVNQPPGCGLGPNTASDLASGHWSRMSPAPLSRRVGAAVTWTGSQLIVWGGASASTASKGVPRRLFANGAIWSPGTNTWAPMAPSPLSGREDAAAIWDGQKMIIWGGGVESYSANLAYDDGATYDPSTNSWAKLPPAPISARGGVTGLWDGRQAIFVAGATRYAGLATKGDVIAAAVYDPTTSSWSRLPVFPAPGRGGAIGITALWSGRELLVWATYLLPSNTPGSIGAPKQVAASWAPGAPSWQVLAVPPFPTLGATATWDGKRAILVGGSSCLPGQLGCVASPLTTSFDPSTKKWSKVSPNRVTASAESFVSTGAALVALDADVGETADNNQTVLSPGDGEVASITGHGWRRLRPFPLGVSQGATTLWTGKDLLVWGGEGPHFDGSVSGALLTPRAR